MPTKLKAKTPGEAKPGHTKLLIFGPAGVGKTWFSATFPNVYMIDTESGADLAHYQKRLRDSGGVYMGPEDGALDFETVIAQMQALATEKHSFKTCVIDSISKLFAMAIAQEAERLGSKDQFGLSKKLPVSQLRRLITWSMRAQCNVVYVAHEAAEWGLVDGKREEIGKMPDVYEKLPYEIDLVLQVAKRGPLRTATVRKSRLTGFPEGESFPLDYEKFAERYGKDFIEAPVEPITLCAPEQATEINRLVGLLHIPEEQSDKWLTKAGASKFSEFTDDQAAKVIKMLSDKLSTGNLTEEDQLP